MTSLSALLAFLALLALPIPTASENLEIYGGLTCNLYPRFSYIVEIYERVGNDLNRITRDAHLHVAVPSKVALLVYGSFQPTRSDSEIVLVVHHDCTHQRNHLTYSVDAGKYHKMDGTYPIYLNFAVDDKGKTSGWPWPTSITEYH